MSKTWDYEVAPGSMRGTMICTVCRKRINNGDYRYRETADAYLSQHRACSEGDPRWARLDKSRERAAENETQRREAFARFVDKWGVPDDLIEEYSS